MGLFLCFYRFGKWLPYKKSPSSSLSPFLSIQISAAAHSFVSSFFNFPSESSHFLIHTVGFQVVNPFQLHKEICFLVYFPVSFPPSCCLSFCSLLLLHLSGFSPPPLPPSPFTVPGEVMMEHMWITALSHLDLIYGRRAYVLYLNVCFWLDYLG